MSGDDRFPAGKDRLDAQQLAAYERIQARRGTVPVPYLSLLARPDLAEAFEQFSALAWQGRLTADVQEAIYLVTARAYRCAHQWRNHEKKALAVGVGAATVAAIRAGRFDALGGATPELARCIRFAAELHASDSVPDEVFDAAAAQADPAWMSELVGFCALAASIAVLLNVRERAPATLF
jgi:4-carboxymuconolactone decarboxylase